MAKLPSKFWVLGGVAVALVIVAAAWLIVISPIRSDASQLRDDAADVQTQNTGLLAKNNKLRDLATHKKQLVAELEAALSGLPSGPNLPVFSRQLASQAAARGVTLTGVSIGSPVTVTPATTTDSTAQTSAPTDTTSADASVATEPQSIPITVTATGSALQQLLFVRDVEKTGPRLALITSASLAPGEGDATGGSIEDSSTLTLQLTVFSNPLPQATRQQLDRLTAAATTN